MDKPIDLLEQTQAELEQVAEEVEATTGVDRREFVYLSLVAAAASTFGAHAARAQGAGAPNATPQQTPPPLPELGNGDTVSWSFQPYPGGTGALFEKTLREKGAKAFERSVFKVDAAGALPSSDEDIAFLPAHRLSALIKAKKITSERLTDIYLTRLKTLNPKLLCAVTIMEESARAYAKQMDAELAAGKYRGPLHGVPYGVKDLFNTKGIPTTWGSQDFENRITTDDAEVVVRLRDAGAVLLAKLSTGLYAQGDQWFRGRTNDPWNLSRGSSGSSAGPASATAGGCVAFGIGTETSGSIVSPTTACGISALRPTFGRVSRYGGMVLAWSQDRVGPITRTVEDAAMVFNAIHGVDEKDPSTIMMPFQFDHNIKMSSLRIGFEPPRAAEGNRGAFAGSPDNWVAQLRAAGAQMKEIGPRPNQGAVMGGGGLNAEYAAAFDDLVRRKAKELGVDVDTITQEAVNRGRGGGGGGGGGGRGNATPIHASSAPNNPAAAGSDWDPRFVGGRVITALDFLQTQRRRYMYITQWAAFMKDLDLYIGSDVGQNAQSGHPCTVLPYKFDLPAGGGGGGGRGGDAAATTTLNKQPICGVLTGQLYNDDIILSVAHQLQIHSDFHTHKPTIT